MHGGDIYRNKIEYDCSVSINPVNIFDYRLDLQDDFKMLLSRYPDISCQELKRVLSKHFKVNVGQIVCTNGASELLGSLCNMLYPKSALINAPAFSGYEKYLNNTGTRIIINYLKEDNDFKLDEDFIKLIDDKQPDIIFITNPNNPDGNLIDPTLKERIVGSAKKANSLLVVDECFIELTENAVKASFLDMLGKYNNMLIIRALTKVYSLPGLRLGYGICSDEELASRINSFLPEWNVSMLAQNIGCKIIGDNEYLLKSREYIARERLYLLKQLTSLGIRVFNTDANYILFKFKKTNNGERLYDYLLKRGILIRECEDYRGLNKDYYRIAVNKHEINELIIKYIREFMVD